MSERVIQLCVAKTPLITLHQASIEPPRPTTNPPLTLNSCVYPTPAAAAASMTPTRLGAGLVASAAAAAFLLEGGVEGHCHQQFPISRQYSWSEDFYDHT